MQRVGGRSLILSNDACAALLNQVPSVPVASSAAAAPMYPIPDEVTPQASMQQQSPLAIYSLSPVHMIDQPEPEVPSWLDLPDPMPSHEPMVVHDTPMDSHPVAPFTVAEALHTIPHPPCLQQTPQPFAHGPAGGVRQRGSAIMLESEGGGYLAQEFMPQGLGQSGQGYQQAPHGYGQVAYESWQMPHGRTEQHQGCQGSFLGGQRPLQGMEEVSQGFRRQRQGSEQVLQGHEQQGCREVPQGGELMPQGLSEDRVIPRRLMYAQMHSQSCSRVHPRSFARTPSFTDEQSTFHFSNIPKLLLQIWYSTLMSEQSLQLLAQYTCRWLCASYVFCDMSVGNHLSMHDIDTHSARSHDIGVGFDDGHH